MDLKPRTVMRKVGIRKAGGPDLARTAGIIGAGVIGVATAYALARRGWDVTLIDAADGPAMGASHANGAQLSYCYTDALGSPWTMAALPRLVFGDGGVKIGLGLDPHYLQWLASFARNCTFARFRENTLRVLHLAQESRSAMDKLCSRHTLEFHHHTAGKINLIYTAKERARAIRLQAIKADAGCDQVLLGREDLCALDPGLQTLDPEVTAAISTPSEVVGDALLFCQSLLRILVRDYGVRTVFDSPVSVVRDGGSESMIALRSGEEIRFDLTVVAAGSASNALLAPLGHRALIQPMKGYSFEIPATSTSPRISVTDGKRRIVFTNLGERIRVAGIAELGNSSHEIDRTRIDWMLNAAMECLPDAGDYSKAANFWTGLRPTTPDTFPVIQRASKTLAINAGHGALGWTLAMGSGERLARLFDAA